MPSKRKRPSSKDENHGEEDEEDVQLASTTNDNSFVKIEELLITISREISDLKSENKNMKEVVYEMKESICAMKNEMGVIKDAIDEMKTKVDDNPTPLWKLVTEWKDVFEKEVLTKLNKTEQKLFSQTCRASREAIKRAKIKLEDKFRIPELSSISQLELAWANYEWGGTVKHTNGREFTKNQEQFCARVAYTNDLALLRWVREEKECAWDYLTSGAAAILGNLEMLKYCVENGCEVGTRTCVTAAKYGNLDCLKYLHEKNVDWNCRASGAAAILGNLEMLKYCVENGCEVDERVCAVAAKYGNLECLKYLREKNVKWNHRTVQFARENNHVDCLNYALANNCPQTREEFQALEAAAAIQDVEEVGSEEEEEEEEEDSEQDGSEASENSED